MFPDVGHLVCFFFFFVFGSAVAARSLQSFILARLHVKDYKSVQCVFSGEYQAALLNIFLRLS